MLSLALAGAETYMLCRGYGVALGSFSDFPFQVLLYTDKYRGWCNQAGQVHDDIDYNIISTVWAENGRASRPLVLNPRRQPSRRILQVGCSFAYGQGLRDDETLAWQFNRDNSDWQMDNYGVIGYGAYQSYKTEQMVLERVPADYYQLIIYEGICWHLRRESDDRYFFYNDSNGDCFTAVYPKIGATLEEERCLHPYRWWGDNLFRTVELAKNLYCTYHTNRVLKWQCGTEFAPGELKVMDSSLIAMKKCADEHGIPFLYLQIDEWPQELSDHLDSLCRQYSIVTLRVNRPEPKSIAVGKDKDGRMKYKSILPTLRDNFHPSEYANREYATALSSWLKREFP